MPAPDTSPPTPQGADLLAMLEQLAQVLQDELEALTQGRDASRIEQLARQKNELCASIEALHEQLGADPAHAARLRELTQQVAQANQRNGAVVAALIRNTRGALDVLRAMPGAEAADVYGPRGRSLGSGPAKPLGSA